MIAMAPQGPVEVPQIVTEFAAGRPVRAVWQNGVGGLTFQVGLAARQFVKWTPGAGGIDLSAEVLRLRWAARFTVVPRVLDEGADEAGSWIVTDGLPGRMAVDDHWKRDPGTAVRAIGAGLRALHTALPVPDCPFDWSAERRLAAVHARAAAGRIDPADWHEDLRHVGTAERALDLLADIPPVDELVVCHGDACAPNTLIGDDGTCTGHVDLGDLGVADRWADLAIATWSTRWNYGPGWEETLLEAYGVAPDAERIRYYRLLWDLSD
ncbi:aminoglycoside 3'-phosphotransferase [Kitasatospora sp. NBC_01250]|uniref:aminoglycoside 3'-phosphotransferase n=1 Tax=unclassified Kitasatospora TaxID=2633591 RepID=UPI002E161A73|nr:MULTISPECIES: aminoglycoside 3'-phosphotransferase [unclassified Kitasatospora]WSJ71338.1 aminoglycoside 3'-phosphotransferase [Kitasatospora sp. NBC_01302]